MAERMSDRYELYRFHLLLRISCEEAEDLLRFGVPPSGVGHVAPFSKESREKILPLLLEADGIVGDACMKMVEEDVSVGYNRDDAAEWLTTIVRALRTRASLLMEAYGVEMAKVENLLDEIDSLINENRTTADRRASFPPAEGTVP